MKLKILLNLSKKVNRESLFPLENKLFPIFASAKTGTDTLLY